jgi:hypothetical protein
MVNNPFIREGEFDRAMRTIRGGSFGEQRRDVAGLGLRDSTGQHD